MKKFEVRSLLALLLAMAMMFALVACGGDENTLPPDTVETDPVVTDPVETDPPETDPPETDPVVTDPVETEGPEETDPKYDPIETDPPETDPVVTEPVETEPPHVHDFKKTSSVAATCQNEGYTEYACKCGETKKDDIKPKSGHVYTTQIISYASCTDEGESADVCVYCGDKKNVEKTPATGCMTVYRVGDIVSLTHHTGEILQCKDCGRVESVTPLEAHSFTCKLRVPDKVAESGDVAYGYEVLVCDCGYEKVVSANVAEGHFFTADEGSGKYVCECGETLKGDFKDAYNGNADAGVSVLPKN
jgi:hypothetical protein